jgi:hypothetical protein
LRYDLRRGVYKEENWGNQAVDGWHFSWAPRGRLRRDDAIIEWVSYITTDGQSASLSWCQAPIWGLW